MSIRLIPALSIDNRRMMLRLLVIVLAMFGFGYALVPMYRAICDALGVNVLSLAEQKWQEGSLVGERGRVNTQVDRSRTITIEFDANVRGPWDFKPAVRSLQVHPASWPR